jgi:hypothetical protein
MQADYLTFDISEIQDFDDKFQVLRWCMQKRWYKFWIFSFHLWFFLKLANSQCVGNDLTPSLQGFGFVI